MCSSTGAYEGWYCVSDEAFVTDLQVEDTVDKVAEWLDCPSHMSL